jgi:hypothetical protein
VTDCPAQIAPEGLAAMLKEGVTFGLTTMVAVPGRLVHPPTVTVSEYVPPAAVVTLVNAGGLRTAAE